MQLRKGKRESSGEEECFQPNNTVTESQQFLVVSSKQPEQSTGKR